MSGPERRKGESGKAYAAFAVYCGMGPQRSVEAAGKVLGKSMGTLERWTRRWGWQERALAHDDAMASAERENALALARAKGVDWAVRYHELRGQEWAMRMQLLEVAGMMVKRWLVSPEQRLGTLEGLARVMDLASVLGRRACEQAAERKEVTGADGGPIRVEFEAALKRLYGEVLPVAAVCIDVATVGGGEVSKV